MDLPRPGTWSHVPGYDSESDSDDGESSDTKEQEEQDESAVHDRLREIVAMLGDRWFEPPLVQFSPAQVRQKGERYPRRSEERPRTSSTSVPCFNMDRTPAPVVLDTFLSNGLCEAGSGQEWCVQWSGPGIRDSAWSEIHEYQRVNHFPGSTALTRKDSMYTHLSQMAKQFGKEAFDFLPETYVLPEQMQAFMAEYGRRGGLWIVKPTNAACGRGIFILRNIRNLPQGSSVVSQYVDRPLLIQGLKFDLRVYVLVTQYDPLRAYIYREGLARFASKAYSTLEEEHLQDSYRHLTNYSINKSAPNFLENQDLHEDNYGHKWSLSALNRHLRCVGVDHVAMWSRIMDLIVKTLLAVEPPISAKTKQLTVHSGTCFEIYGFDVLVDEDLKPWILEVNLSPSMQADSPLDWQVKSSLLSDAFNLIGVCHADFRAVQTSRLRGSLARARQSHKALIRERANSSMSGLGGLMTKRHSDGNGGRRKSAAPAVSPLDVPVLLDSLSEAQLKLLARSLQEQERCQNFIRLYPTRGAVERYRPFLEARSGLHLRAAGGGAAATGGSAGNALLAALLFGPPPRRSRAASLSQVPAAPQPAGLRGSGRKSYVASLRRSLEALQMRQPPSSPESPVAGAAAAQSGRSAVPSPASRSPGRPTAAETPVSEEEASGNSGREETPRRPRRGSEKARHSPRAFAGLEFEDRQRLAFMEYLARMVRYCNAMGAEDRAALAQSGAFSRLSKFRARVQQLTRQLVASPRKSGQLRRSLTEAAGHACLVEEVLTACRSCLDAVANLPWSMEDEEGEEDDGEEYRGSLAPFLPEELCLAAGPRRRALALLPVLGPAELEGYIRGGEEEEWAELFSAVDASDRHYSPLRELLQSRRRHTRPKSLAKAQEAPAATAKPAASAMDVEEDFSGTASPAARRRAGSLPLADALISFSGSYARGRPVVLAHDRLAAVAKRPHLTSQSPLPPPQPLHVLAPAVSRQWSAPLLPDIKAMQKQALDVRQKPAPLPVAPTFGSIEL